MGLLAIGNVPTFGLIQIALFGAIAETTAIHSGRYTGGPQDHPGGFDWSSRTIPGGYPFITQIEDPEECDRNLNIEIQN